MKVATLAFILILLSSSFSLATDDQLLDHLAINGGIAKGLVNLPNESRMGYYSHYFGENRTLFLDSYFFRVLADSQLDPRYDLNVIYRDLSKAAELQNSKIATLDEFVIRTARKRALSWHAPWHKGVQVLILNVSKYASVTDNPEVAFLLDDLSTEVRYRMKHGRNLTETWQLVQLNNKVVWEMDHLSEYNPALVLRARRYFSSIPRKCGVLLRHLF